MRLTKRLTPKSLILVGTFLTLIPAAALAQAADGPPTYGEFRLSAEGLPDESLLSVVAGGAVEAALRAGSDTAACKGFTASAPDARLVWTGESAGVRLSAVSNADTTLVVRTPDGRWLCDDDSGEDANPSIALTAQAGRYDIWVGTYSKEERKKAVLSASATFSF